MPSKGLSQCFATLFAIHCFWPLLGTAQTASVEGLCRSLHAQNPSKLPDVAASWLDLFKFAFHRSDTIGVGYYDHGHVIEIKDQASFARSNRRKNQEPGSTRIFSLGPTEKLNDADRSILDEAYWIAVKLSRDVEALKKPSSLSSCVSRAKELNLDDGALDHALAVIDRGREAQLRRVNGASFELAGKAARFFNEAQVIGARSFDEIIAELRGAGSKDRALNLVLVLHGTEDGLLIDASGLIVSRPQWNEFSTSLDDFGKIGSITIYSCFPEQVARFYSEAFDRLNSEGVRIYFPINFLSWGDSQTTPLRSLDVFSQKLAGVL